MSNFKDKAKEKYETAKAYVKEHKEDIIVGAGSMAITLWSILVIHNDGYRKGIKDGICKGCTLQNEYDKAVIDNALEMNKYINNYDNEEDK